MHASMVMPDSLTFEADDKVRTPESSLPKMIFAFYRVTCDVRPTAVGLPVTAMDTMINIRR